MEPGVVTLLHRKAYKGTGTFVRPPWYGPILQARNRENPVCQRTGKFFIIPSVSSAGTIRTSFASTMGAKISISGPPRGMYLIIGAETLPDGLAEQSGGKTVLRLNGRKLLAVLPFEGYLSLKQDRRTAHIGPVTVDMKRLTTIAGMLGSSRPAGA